ESRAHRLGVGGRKLVAIGQPHQRELERGIQGGLPVHLPPGQDPDTGPDRVQGPDLAAGQTKDHLLRLLCAHRVPSSRMDPPRSHSETYMLHSRNRYDQVPWTRSCSTRHATCWPKAASTASPWSASPSAPTAPE